MISRFESQTGRRGIVKRRKSRTLMHRFEDHPSFNGVFLQLGVLRPSALALAAFFLACPLLNLSAAQLPLASVRYFNPYQNPTNWGNSAIYSGGGATVSNIN